MEQIIATHIVKPSSPPPVGFKHHKLSCLDQVGQPVYIPLIFFYEPDQSKHPEEITLRLKQSLSEILTIFYPLSGTIKQNSFVDCVDRGAEFVEARVHARLGQLIQNPKMEELKQLVPVDTSSSHNDNAVHLLVKTSYFDCGGIAIGVCFPHRIGDTSSFVSFMNAWAATCRGESSRIIHPSFDMALHFPPRDSLSSAPAFNVAITKEKFVTKRLVFEREKVEKLRKQAAACSDEVKHPSAVEAVSVFIWRCFIEAYKASMVGGTTPSMSSFAASHMVNLRPRSIPQLPDQSFGNGYMFARAVVSSSEEDIDDDVDYASKLRGAITAVDDDYINKVINGDLLFQTLDQVGDLFKPGNCVFTSWRRFPVYDVDFGWGKPIWVCTTPMPYLNFVVLIDTPSGEGIEAWVNIPHNDLFLFFQANYNKLLN